MNDLQVRPFLKWPGGKRWLAHRLTPILSSELQGTYYEPFLGAGAVFLALAPATAILADTNRSLIDFLRTVRKQPNEVVEAVWRLSNTRECYYDVRSRVPRTKVGRAARFLYLNRTCWGGVHRLNREGTFNVPFGDSGREIICRQDVIAAAKAFGSAKLYTKDFESLISPAGKGDVIYCDPPYTTKGAGNGFIRYNESLFSWEDQERLSMTCRRARRRGAFVAVSGLNHFEFLDLYRGWWVAEFKRPSTVGRIVTSRHSVSEVVVFSRKPKGGVGINDVSIHKVS